MLQNNYFPNQSVTPEKDTVPLVIIDVYKEPYADIIEVSECSCGETPLDVIGEKATKHGDTNKQMMHHMLLQQVQ